MATKARYDVGFHGAVDGETLAEAVHSLANQIESGMNSHQVGLSRSIEASNGANTIFMGLREVAEAINNLAAAVREARRVD